MGIFNFTDNGKRQPSPSWTKKVGKIMATIFDLEDGSHPVARVGNKETFTEVVTSAGQTIMMPDLWKVYNDRKSVYKDIEQMDTEDELVSTALDIVADFIAADPKKSFQIVSKDKEVERILNSLSTRLKLSREVWQIVRAFYKHGNEFREVIIDRSVSPMRIKGFKQTVSYQIWPKTNDMGDKLPGWLVVKDQDVSMNGGKELEEWQIVPFYYGEMKGALAVAPLASARKGWMRLSTMEDGMVVARLTRAYDKVVHRIPVKTEWTRDEIMSTIKRYKDAVTKRKLVASDGTMTNVDNPLSVDTDFYLPDDGTGKGGVSMLSANNTQLGNLNDIYYHREKLLTRLKVPISYLQIMSSQKTHLTAGSGVSNAELAFARTLQVVEATLEEGLRRLFDMELMLNGIAPSEDLYEIILTKINTKDLKEDADIELTYAQAAVYFIEAFGALPAELLASKFMHLSIEQQEMMDKFLGADAKKIWKAKIKSIEAGADAIVAKSDLTKDRLPGDNKGAGSGNQNKSRASRASEQKGVKAGAKQGIDMEALVDIFAVFYDGLADDLRAEGQDIPTLNEADREDIRQAILGRVSQDGELIVS